MPTVASRWVLFSKVSMTTKTSLKSKYFWREGRSWHGSGNPVMAKSVLVNSQVANEVTHHSFFPDYEDRIRSHKSATTPLSGVLHEFNNPNDGYCYYKSKSNIDSITAEIRGCLLKPDLAIPEDPSNYYIESVKNGVIQDINGQIRSAQKSLQGLVALGELGDSVRMVNRLGRDIFGKTENYLRDLSKVARRLTPQNIMRTVSEKWLEYRFGVRPMVNDIGGFIDACYNNRYGKPPRVLIRRANQSMFKKASASHTGLYNEIYIDTIAERQCIYGFKLYGCVGLSDSAPPPAFSQEFGLTLDEFVPTLWELIPYSFLFDYVANVGAIIDAYSLNKSGLRWLAYGEMRKSEIILSSTYRLRYSKENLPSSSWKVQETSSRPCTPLTMSRRHVSRGNYDPGYLVPSLEFKIPGTSTQWLNIGALSALHADTSHRLRRGYSFR